MKYFTFRPRPVLGVLSLSTVLLSGGLSGCSSSNSGDGDSLQTGTLIDSPVEGLSFRTGSTEAEQMPRALSAIGNGKVSSFPLGNCNSAVQTVRL